MAIKWSDEQLLAIEESGKSILVNAGAGSGKTAVLTERLLRKVQSGVKLKNLIVLTFTKLASSEMKERLRKVLIKELNRCPNPNIEESLNYIDQANIQTFDAYTSELVRKYHYLLDLPKQINIIDSASFEIEKQRVIECIFDKLYKSSDEKFLNFLKAYTAVNDDSIKQVILDIYTKIIDNNELEILDNYEYLFSDEYYNDIFQKYCNCFKDIVLEISSNYEAAKMYTANKSLDKNYKEYEPIIKKLISAQSYDDYLFLINQSLPRTPGKVSDPEEKEMYVSFISVVKDSIKAITEKLVFENENEIKALYLNTRDHLEVITSIIKDLHLKIQEFKKKKNCYEFNDVALMAIQILKENKEVREAIKYSTDEILVDEYQDTSNIQEELINLISNNNVYMVGDVKQSIYRFRHANPDLFIKKYDYLNEPSNNGMVIDLSDNYRSRSEVLSPVNEVFRRVMNKKIGGVLYDNRHTLKYGFKSYDQYVQENVDYKMKVMIYDNGEDEDYKRYNDSEIEAFIIGRDIKSRIKNRKVYDKDLESLRDSKYSDYAILASTKDSFELYKKVFEYLEIPLNVYKDEEFSYNDEIYALSNLFKVILGINAGDYSDDFKLALISVLRSFIIGACDMSISSLVVGNFFDNFKKQFSGFYDSLVKFNAVINTMTLTHLVDLIFDELEIYKKMIKLQDVNSVEVRLNNFRSIISNLQSMDYSLKDVCEYFDKLISDDEKYQMKIKKGNQNEINAVKIMTIHASKGLEFPFCYFPELSKRFNKSELRSLISYTNKFRFNIPFIKDGIIQNSFIQTLEEDSYITEEISERIRLFYVALTRPREEIILLMKCPKKLAAFKSSNGVHDFIKKKYNSFFDLCFSIFDYLENHLEFVNLYSLQLSKAYKYFNKDKEFKNDFVEASYNFINYQSTKQIAYKVTASMSSDILDKNQLELMEVGTSFHKSLEMIDLKNPDYSFIDSNKIGYIEKFIRSDFLQTLNIINVYHEYNYSYTAGLKREVGIIDLIIETDDKLIVIDYKLNDITKEEYIAQVNKYMTYLKTISTKTVVGYLYSICQGVFKEVQDEF